MASTAARKPKPLDDYTEQRLRSLGWKPVPVARTPGVLSWRHLKYRDLPIDLTVLNLPGSTDVVAKIAGMSTTKFTADAFIALLQWEIEQRSTHTQKESR